MKICGFVGLLAIFSIVPMLADAQEFATGELALNGTNIENGTLVEAVNFYAGDDATPNPFINGVQFLGYSGTSLTGPHFSVNNNGVDAGRAGGVSSGDAVYPLVLDGVYNTASSNHSVTFQLTNLDPGTEYSAQLFFDSAADGTSGRTNSVTDNGVTSDTVTAGETDSNGNVIDGPVFITDTFTASSATETLTINSISAYSIQFSGFVLDTVPEPSTDALLGLGFIGLVLLQGRIRAGLRS